MDIPRIGHTGRHLVLLGADAPHADAIAIPGTVQARQDGSAQGSKR
jgi:hypothetical protein